MFGEKTNVEGGMKKLGECSPKPVGLLCSDYFYTEIFFLVGCKQTNKSRGNDLPHPGLAF
jgi:hypothetical protein